ncbi:MAG: hypothetical protein M8354_10380 [Halalkalicoccus sp.]|nr:hypothetical protein [Halalkalicoccus sp.]
MVDQSHTDDPDSNNHWTRRTFISALGAAGIAGTGATVNAQTQPTDPVVELENATDGNIDLRAFDEVLGRLERAADALEFPARRIGSAPRGQQHGASRWGIHFDTDQPIHLGTATVDAGRAGTFTAVVADYNGNNQFTPVHQRDITVDAGINEITLDMALEPGEYLLTREGGFPLRRSAWSGWESQSRDGLELYGGSKPGYESNRYWYYYFDLHVAAHEDAHL